MARLSTLGVVIDPTGAKRGAQEVKGALGEIETSAERAARSIKDAAQTLAVAFGGTAILGKAIRETVDAERAFNVMAATVRATGGAADRTLGQLQALTAQITRVSGEGATAVQGGLTRLLTYTTIQGDLFDRAAMAASDMAAALGTDLTQAAETVGRALGSPEFALSALAKQGFRFSDAQQATIKSLVETGDVAAAQVIILEELESVYKGTAAAAQQGLGGALRELRVAVDGLFEASTGETAAFADALRATAQFVEENKTAIQSLALAIGTAGLAKSVAAATVALRGMAGAQTLAAITSLIPAISSTRDALALAALAGRAFWAALTGPIGIAVAGVLAVAAAINVVRQRSKEAAAEAKAFADAVGQADERTANLQLAKAEADRVAAVRAAENAVPGIATRRAAEAVAEATARTQAWTDRLRELRTASAEAAAATAAAEEEARKAAAAAEAAARQKAAAAEAARRAKEAADALARAQQEQAAAVREAEARWVLLTIQIARNTEAQRQARLEYARYAQAQQDAITDVREEIAAVLAGGLALRELAIARAADRAEIEARSQAQQLGITLTADEIAQARERGATLESEIRRLAALKEMRAALANGENPFSIPDDAPAKSSDFARGLQDALFAAQGLASAFGEAGREIAQIISGVNTAAQGIGRLRDAASATNTAGQAVGIGGALSGAGGAGAALAAVSGVGAVFAGVVSVISGFTSAARRRAEELRQSAEAFERGLEAFRRAATGSSVRVLDQLAEVEKTFRDLVSNVPNDARAFAEARNAAKANTSRVVEDFLSSITDAFNAASGNEAVTAAARAQKEYADRVAALNELVARRLLTEDQYRAALEQSAEVLAMVTQAIEDAAAAEVARLAAEEAARARAREFNARDIELRERALTGEDVTADRLRLNGDRELDAARKLVEAGELSEDMFLRLAEVIGGEITAALQAAEEAAARAAQAVQDDLAVRTLLAQGNDAGAAALRREIAWRNELVGVTDEGLRAQIEYVQQLEREAIVKGELAAAAEAAAAAEQARVQQNQSIDERMLRAQGRTEEADALRLQIAREAELRNAVDETTRARLEELFAMEDAAAAAKQLTTELEAQARQAQRLADLTVDLDLDLLREQGNTFEADRRAIIAAGEKRRQELIAAGASAETLANLDTLINLKLDNLVARTLGEGAAALASGGSGGRSGVVDASSVRGLGNLTEGSALRLIDVATTQLSVLRNIERNTGGAGGGGVSITVSVQTGLITGTTPRALGQAIAQEIAPLVNESLGRTVGRDRDLTGSARLGDR
jgi:hypothetical protein